MPPRLFTVCAAATALLVLPTAADAKVCNLVSDKAGDAAIAHGANPVKSDATDIRSMDVATGKKNLVVVLRMQEAAKGSDDPVAQLSVKWQASFVVGGVEHTFTRYVDAQAQGGAYSDTATAGGTAIKGVTVKMDGKDIVWTVPKANVPKLRAKKAVLTGFLARTSSTMTASDSAPDGATGSKAKYTTGTASCVKAS